jgi:hypothetical protein
MAGRSGELSAGVRTVLACAVLACTAAARAEAADAAADLEFFETKVRPVLAERCFKCHSHQSEKLKGGLYVDSREGLLAGGETAPAVVPGNPAKSLMIEAISYTNPDLQMPTKTRLSAEQVADLTEWVRRGAPWPAAAVTAAATATAGSKPAFDLKRRKAEWWAWQPVRPTAPPAVEDAGWAHGDIDRFILAKLEEQHLRPAPAADRRTLIRRLYEDLIGLPPAPAEVDAFLADTSPGAVATVVDRLLASPQFGVRWARHWLDLVRYAESRGHEFDFAIPNAFQYRDYVVRAFNADVPYDRFVAEHIAGDLLPDPRTDPKEGFDESVIGTGFWFLGEGVHSPVDIRQDQADRCDNMIDVMGKTFMGLTVACARCHDHKFDAIAAKDYYALSGFIESSAYRQVRFDTVLQERATAAKLWRQRHEQTAPIAQAVAASYRPVLERLDVYLLAAREALRAPVAGGPGDEQVFADFESGTYTGWEATGTAFGKGPRTLETISPIQGRINCVGRYFVNTYCHETNGDGATGTLTSMPFTIAKPYLRMLVGGGDYVGRTCVDLVIDGKAVLSATGRRSNQMSPVTWDLRPFAGKTARLRIVDAETGGWGNIGVDQIVFSSTPGESPGGAPALGPADVARITALAEARKLDGAVLVAWAGHLLAAARQPADPFHAWAEAALDPARPAAVAVPPAPAAAAPAQVDYAALGDDGWFPDGVAFGAGPARAGELRLGTDPLQPVAEVAGLGMAAFDPFWQGLKRGANAANDPLGLDYERAGRTLCTRTFEIAADHLFALVRGSGHIYAAVGQHALINGPLHGALVRGIEPAEGFHWVEMNLEAYRGLRTHLEFSAGSADFAVAQVVQADRQPPAPASGGRALLTALAAAGADPTAQAAAYRTVLGEVAARLDKLAGSADAADLAPLADWLVRHPRLLGAGAAPLAAAQPFLAAQAKLAGEVRPDSRLAMAMMDGSGVDAYVMKRGSWRNRGEDAPRRLLEAIAGDDQPRVARGSGRLELAKRMTDPANPFTARVMVNRLWHHLFGRGIVPSVDNFGVLGSEPSHPALLDHLAAEFMKQGWSVKRAIRAMVLSATYQMASTAEPAADQADPDDRWLHRMPVRRLEAETIRDAILAVSGRLDAAMGGPSVPIFLTSFMEGRGRPDSGPLDGGGRRSLYLSIRRNFLSPMMMAFDAPTPFNAMGRRTVSNVPAQALILMNDPFVVEEAKRWAGRVLAEPGLTAAQRVARMYQAAFARPPTSDELAAVTAFLAEHPATLGRDPAKGDDPAVWADLAHALMNCKEFFFIN